MQQGRALIGTFLIFLLAAVAGAQLNGSYTIIQSISNAFGFTIT